MHFDHEPPEPHRTGHRWVDFTIAGSALLISVVSLFVAIRHGETMDEMAQANARLVQANSWPFLGAHLSRGEKDVEIGFSNKGVGPAKIAWVEISYDGVPARTMSELLTRCCGFDAENPIAYKYSVMTNSVLRAGESDDLLFVANGPRSERVFRSLSLNLLKIRLRACYCSVFDECFIGDGRSLDVTSVKTCLRPTDAFRDDPTS
jgi:hypothetical protein